MMIGRKELKRITRNVKKDLSFKKGKSEGLSFLVKKTLFEGNNKGEEGVTR